MFSTLIKFLHMALAVSSSDVGDVLADLCPELTTIEIIPFITENNANPTKHSFNPYSQFDTIVAFLSVIPDVKKTSLDILMNNTKGMSELASNVVDYTDYDVHSVLFYNADSCSGIYNLKYDICFIKYFLVRFYYFLEVTFIKSYGFTFGNNLRRRKDHTPIDLLTLPASLEDTYFDSETVALNIFNDIIADTLLTDIVISFIKTILFQLNQAWTDKNEYLTTRDLHSYTLEKYLQRTLDIVKCNYNRKDYLVKNSKMLAFAMLKVANENPQDSHVTSKVEFGSWLLKKHMVKNIN